MATLLLPPSALEGDTLALRELYADAVLAGCAAFRAGDHYHDSSLYGNHGTLEPDASTGPQWEWNDYLGRWVLRFDGSNDYVELGSRAPWQNDQAGTIAAWIRPSVALGTIVGYGDSTSGLLNLNVRTGVTPGGVPRLDVTHSQNGGSIQGVHGSTTLSVDQWYHCAVVSDGASYSLYVNGDAESLTAWTGTNNGNWYGDTNADAADSASIGAVLFNNARQGFATGLIADALIFSRALSPAEITLLADPSFRVVRGEERWWAMEYVQPRPSSFPALSGPDNRFASISGPDNRYGVCNG